MFLGTVLQNITYDLSLSGQEIEEAVSVACCKRFIEQW
jgi:ABC-type multidrug transport system fused ATPase/permease subunit